MGTGKSQPGRNSDCRKENNETQGHQEFCQREGSDSLESLIGSLHGVMGVFRRGRRVKECPAPGDKKPPLRQSKGRALFCQVKALIIVNPTQTPARQRVTESRTFSTAPVTLPCSSRRNVWRLKEENVV